jgi:hypothetical protein
MGLITLFKGWEDQQRNGTGRQQSGSCGGGDRYRDLGGNEDSSDGEPSRERKLDQVLDLGEGFAKAFVRRCAARIAGQEASGRLLIEIPKVNCDAEFASIVAALRIRCFRLVYRNLPL